MIDAMSIPRWRLEELAWTEYLASPPAATSHLHEFVSTIVELCCMDEEGEWCNVPKLLLAFVRATETLSSIRVSDEEVAKLFELALQGESKMDGIRFWFQVTFPPPTP